MQSIPEAILTTWKKRDHACVLTTVSAEGIPNTIYVSCCELMGDNRILICNSAFSKTLENLENGSRHANFLFFAPGSAAYQLKGTIAHHTEGPVYEEGKQAAKPEFGICGIAEFTITEAYEGSTRLL
jgi:predicted pyridoxine 5'-phosphate oxidase superfamily flavin-nucleotide-binding protein